LKKALLGYAQWWTEYEFPGCKLPSWRNIEGTDIPEDCEGYGYSEFNGTYNTECFKALDSQNVVYKDLSVSNAVNRQWMWLLCNEP
jgi:hypothetical protein